MNKSRIKPVKSGRNIRMSYSRQKEVLEMPNLIEVQKNSYDWFLKKGLKEVFEDISPITVLSSQISVYVKRKQSIPSRNVKSVMQHMRHL